MAASPTPEHLRNYREMLVAAEQKSQEQFDKTVLSLSGGALGISFIFLKDVVGTNPIQMPFALMAAWGCWGASALAVLISFHMSGLTIRHCIRQIDECIEGNFGGPYAKWTAFLNAAGAVLFFVGVLAIVVFASANLAPTKKEGANGNPSPAAAPTTAATPVATTTTTRSDTEHRAERRRLGAAESSAASEPQAVMPRGSAPAK